MLKPSVCIDAVLEGRALSDSLELVAELGFQAFEFWMWWEKDLEMLQSKCQELDLSVAACCTKFVSLVDPAVRERYLEGLRESIAAAQRLECPVLISQVGDFRSGVPRSEQHDCLVAGLKAATELLEGSGVTLAIEPLNELVDHAGYYLTRSDEAFDIVNAVNHPQIKVTFDIYHQQITEGHLIHNITKNIDRIAHFHAAGNPGRHELSQGEINYQQVISAIASTGYQGYFGLEYWPLEEPIIGLKEAAKWFV